MPVKSASAPRTGCGGASGCLASEWLCGPVTPRRKPSSASVWSPRHSRNRQPDARNEKRPSSASRGAVWRENPSWSAVPRPAVTGGWLAAVFRTLAAATLPGLWEGRGGEHTCEQTLQRRSHRGQTSRGWSQVKIHQPGGFFVVRSALDQAADATFGRHLVQRLCI